MCCTEINQTLSKIDFAAIRTTAMRKKKKKKKKNNIHNKLQLPFPSRGLRAIIFRPADIKL